MSTCPETNANGQRCALEPGHAGAHQPWVMAGPQTYASSGTPASDILRALFGILAAAVFALAGLAMVGIRSQAGNTVAELFYNAVGVFAFGVALLSLALAVPRARR